MAMVFGAAVIATGTQRRVMHRNPNSPSRLKVSWTVV